MEIRKDDKGKVDAIVLEENDYIRIATKESDRDTCVHVEVEEGKLVLTGGSSIIGKICGEGMLDKIVEE